MKIRTSEFHILYKLKTLLNIRLSVTLSTAWVFNALFAPIAAFLMAMVSPSAVADIYKYKDANGKWVFTDRKPQDETEFEEQAYSGKERQTGKPAVFTEEKDKQYFLVVNNPLYAPVEVEIKAGFVENGTERFVVEPNSRKVLYQNKKGIPKYHYRWAVGESSAKHDNYTYHFPFASGLKHRITQAFHGRFSHNHQGSRYAVDIAAQVGTLIVAAREGTVMFVKDDYHMGGRDRYFLDKANVVMVMHSDGTYAVYAHILLGSAKVKVGDEVQVGQVLAMSGSSGFSTGPHLHFVIRRNRDMSAESVPFKFGTREGGPFSPAAGMTIATKQMN